MPPLRYAAATPSFSLFRMRKCYAAAASHYAVFFSPLLWPIVTAPDASFSAAMLPLQRFFERC
jgi:hypothetical protein